VITVDGSQTSTTNALKKTFNPIWNASFSLSVNPSSLLCIQIYDQKRFKRKGKGFLGLAKIPCERFIENVNRGQEGKSNELRVQSTIVV
jgi:E3 ubiquitin-protein ligase NEDD4